MKAITEHVVDGDSVNHHIQIHAVDDPGAGGAHHEYEVAVPHNGGLVGQTVRFQKGPIKEVGLNGITNEALLAIVADRLRGFQSGSYACDENEQALMAVQSALFHLQTRTKERIKRNVEGTYTK